jgi:signal transduction histidine kinase/CheY-like chemotaxis protein
MEEERERQSDAGSEAPGRKPLTPAGIPVQLSRFLAEATGLLLSAVEYEAALTRLAGELVPLVGDWCAVDLLEADGRVRRVAVAHADPERRGSAARLLGTFAVDPGLDGGPLQAVATGRPVRYADVAAHEVTSLALDPERVAVVRELGAARLLCVPLRAHDRVLGALSLVRTPAGAPHDANEMTFARILGDRVGLAVDRARLHRAEQKARRAAERASRRAARLQTLGASLAEAITADQVGAVIVGQGLEAVGASTGALLLVSEADRTLAVVVAAGYPEPVPDEFQRFPIAAPTPLGEAVRTGAPVLTPSAADRAARYPAFARSHAHYEAGVSIPLVQRGRALGVVAFGFPEPRALDPDDLAFLLTLARQCGQALERAELYEAERRARAAAEAANRAKDEFLATLSHELRTPLTAMLGWIRLLRTGRLDPVSAGRALEVIERNVRVQGQLIGDLLDVSRIISGKVALETGPVDLRSVVEGALDAARPAAAAKTIRLDAALDPGATVITGDAGRLQQVVANLLSNAVKFTPAGGRVDVVLRRDPAHVELAVRDTGQGIRPDFLPFVFDAFRQEDSTVSRTHTGLGLGLAIVRHLVQLHGGSVAADSPGEGGGATFTVRLPSPAALGPAASPGVDTAAPAPVSLAGLRVVVVDDEPDTLAFVAAALQGAGASVAPAASAAEARAALHAARPDVLVCDLGMPGESGYSVIRDVRALEPERGGRLPAVALTAYASVEDRERALSAGFDRHVAKPVDPSDLVAMVAALAGRGAGGAVPR